MRLVQVLALLCWSWMTTLAQESWVIAPVGLAKNEDSKGDVPRPDGSSLFPTSPYASERTRLLGIARLCLQDAVALRGRSNAHQEVLTSLLQQQYSWRKALESQGQRLLQLQERHQELLGRQLVFATQYATLEEDHAALQRQHTGLLDETFPLRAALERDRRAGEHLRLENALLASSLQKTRQEAAALHRVIQAQEMARREQESTRLSLHQDNSALPETIENVSDEDAIDMNGEIEETIENVSDEDAIDMNDEMEKTIENVSDEDAIGMNDEMENTAEDVTDE